MAVYTEVSDAELNDFLKGYDIGDALAFKGIAEGVENSNYYLETTQNRFILTLFEKRVKREDLPFFIHIKAHLADKGFPAPRPIADSEGNRLNILCGRPALLISFLQGMSPKRPNISQCKAVGVALAELHKALADCPLSRPNDLSLEGWIKLYRGQEKAAASIAPDLDKKLTQDLSFLKVHWPQNLPSGIIHADLFPDNAFFLGDDFAGAIDFYFACNDFLAYDLAVCLNAWCFEPRGEYNVTKGQAMISGYQAVRQLKDQEIAAIPTLALGAAMRFFLTRLYDWSNTPEDALVKPKNPLEYADQLGFHRRAKNAFDYGVL